ncbi:Sad1 unc domain protein [Apiospora hydei]|uniref:Sad1 unc domain protein n=1 Tax=Apiospora hydei TaxID=1337664 RepID=A0ABR1UPZ8_9PEZI
MMWRHRDRRSVWSLLPIWVPLFLLVAGVQQVQAQQPGDDNASSTGYTSGSTSTSTSSSATITAHDATRSLPPSTTAQSTCESRTVNYITHTLPQQCLTTTHSSTPAPSTESAADPAHPTPPTAAAASASEAAQKVEEEHELDSDGNDLSTGAFMSFEEWKEMMLKKAGQEPLEARTRKPHDGRGDYPGDDLGSIGEEGEISLDFDAYSDKISEITSSGKPVQKQKKEKEDQVEKVAYDEGLAHVYRSKDAGKTCKERYSYSSFDAGATVIKTSKGAKNSKAILVENKDSYMLLECATANKFFIVELSEDILVDTVVLANYEFFSSMIRQFRVSVSDRYPIKSDKWKVLGDFQARNSRDIQPFLIQNPQIWARYLRIEILSHYGNEFYCPLSLLRVHGTRMLDSWKEADPADFEEEEPSKAAPEPVAAETEAPVQEIQETVEVEEPILVEEVVAVPEQSLVLPFWDGSYLERELQQRTTCKISDSLSNASSSAVGEDPKPMPEAPLKDEQSTESNKAQAETARPSSQNPTTEPAGSAKPTSSTAPPSATSAVANSTENPTTPKTSAHPVESTQSSGPPIPPTKHTIPASARPSNTAAAKSKAASGSSSVKPPPPKSSPNMKPGSTGTSASPRNRTTTPTSSAPASTPTVQDSFFKQLTKRLQTLESNTTLSLQYIESQSQFLQQALSKLERRQVAKVDLFLDTLNKTVLSELRDLRVQYDQIWQSTVIALETQRDQSERELLAVSSRLGALADEVVFQKRMAIVQSVLLLGCLFLVIFSGRLANGGVELYYPSQFLPGSGGGGGGGNSRMGSPMYPSTPKAGVRRGGGERTRNAAPHGSAPFDRGTGYEHPSSTTTA